MDKNGKNKSGLSLCEIIERVWCSLKEFNTSQINNNNKTFSRELVGKTEIDNQTSKNQQNNYVLRIVLNK